MSDKTARRLDDGGYEKRNVTGAIITGAAAGTANAVVTQTMGALKRPKKKKK
jgi:hypothetical protein